MDKRDLQTQNAELSNDILSVIIRCHKRERLSFLDEALFSLAIQSWQNLEVIVVIQNGNDEFIKSVSELINKQPFFEKFRYKVFSVKIPPGVDGRSSLLTYGIKNAAGRYLAFLDDDDVVYQHGYNTLIEQLKNGQGAVAAGGCRLATLKNEFGAWHIEKKEKPFTWGRNHFDLFKDNFVPIHSFVIDRKRINAEDLYFNDNCIPLEDYEFLLRLGAKYIFDFSKIDVFICEYRMHGDNTLEFNPTLDISENHRKSVEYINKLKEETLYSLPISHITHILSRKTTDKTVPESILTKSIPIEISGTSENLRVFKMLLDAAEERIYQFFRNYPKIEKKLSNIARYGYENYSERKLRDEEKNSTE